MNEDEKWMQFAILEANIAKGKREVPVGSILVQNNQIISKAHNCPISKNNDSSKK